MNSFKWSIHPALSIVIFYFIVTQQLLMYSLLLLSLIIHELGHILAAKWLRVNVRQLLLLPFGGQLTFMPTTARNMLYITVAGPAATLLSASVSFYFEWDLFYQLQWLLIAFNILPIWPLDGGKAIYFSMQLSKVPVKYEQFISYSFVCALSLCILSFLWRLPFFIQIAFGLLMFETFRAFRARKYVQALEVVSRKR